MDEEAFRREYEAYTLDDLNMIYSDQAELFSPEERALLQQILREKEQPDVPEPPKRYSLLYLISFLCFPAGMVFFILFMMSHDPVKEKAGVRCELLTLTGLILLILLLAKKF